MCKPARDGVPCLSQHGSPQLAANHTLLPACKLLNGPPGHGIEGYLKKHIFEDGLTVYISYNRITVYFTKCPPGTMSQLSGPQIVLGIFSHQVSCFFLPSSELKVVLHTLSYQVLQTVFAGLLKKCSEIFCTIILDNRIGHVAIPSEYALKSSRPVP